MLYPLSPFRCSPHDLAEIARELAANRFPLYSSLAAICAGVLVLETIIYFFVRRSDAWQGRPRWMAVGLPLAAAWAISLALWALYQSTHYIVAWSCIVIKQRIPWTQTAALRVMPIAVYATLLGTAALGTLLAVAIVARVRRAKSNVPIRP